MLYETNYPNHGQRGIDPNVDDPTQCHVRIPLRSILKVNGGLLGPLRSPTKPRRLAIAQ